MFIKCFGLLTCNVCVPLYVSVTASEFRLASPLKITGGDGVSNGQLQHLLLHSSSHFSLSSSRFFFQEEHGACGRVRSAINAGCQKENAGVYEMRLNH